MPSATSSEASSPPTSATEGSLSSSASPTSSSSPTPTPTTIPTIKTPRSPKPSLPALKTPSTATLPSEIPRSPAPGMLDIIKKEEDIKTPITPPQAYTEFLKALSPAISSPGTARSASFSSSGKSTPSTQPSSAGSSCLSCTYDPHKCPTSSASMIPPSPYMRPPSSARTPTALRRLRIPQSPVHSPATDSPRSAAMRSPFSPADWHFDGKTRFYEPPRSGCARPVSVRQVVTKTVTYTRTPLDPAPKGKRRKLE
ncbi:MAG: hypothetical protein Q9174_001411 [Haloplaca sp. 1 TL-2023]